MTSRTQIIATIGPSSGEEAIVAELISLGMDVARINFSHGTFESNGSYIAAIRAAARAANKRVPLIQDLAGPRGQTSSGHAFDSAKAEITEKDLIDLEFGITQGVEYIAQSYVGGASDIEALRAEIEKRGAAIPIIAKIERAEAVTNIDEIIASANAIMIARGDLGLAVPMEDLPFIERDTIRRAKLAGKPVIVATEMLFSMTEHPTPERAEVTDVAFAVLCVADAIMLSDETARGKYPKEAVKMMETIAARAEQDAPQPVRNPL
ncbi:MAG: pyruvate kinase [Candidatus Paceibacterota bacterium]